MKGKIKILNISRSPNFFIVLIKKFFFIKIDLFYKFKKLSDVANFSITIK